ncbi:MAG: LicD family protein [Prolixibacteraceae bacterium]|nr:LicD family protein [Prolixibacteraceae bacterium]
MPLVLQNDKGIEYYSTSGLKLCQDALLEGMKVLDKLLSEAKIDYWLTAGSLLGAKRHQGFIPWDDDLDICVLSSDYPRLIKHLHDYQSEDYEFHPYFDDFVGGFFCKKYIRFFNSWDKGCMYPKIDIFQVATIPPLKRKGAKKLIDEIKKNKFNLANQLIDSLYPSTKKISFREAFLYSAKANNYKYIPLYNFESYCYYDKKDLFPLLAIPFEDTVFWSPQNADRYLSTYFGNYNSFPPLDQRKPTHGLRNCLRIDEAYQKGLFENKKPKKFKPAKHLKAEEMQELIINYNTHIKKNNFLYRSWEAFHNPASLIEIFTDEDLSKWQYISLQENRSAILKALWNILGISNTYRRFYLKQWKVFNHKLKQNGFQLFKNGFLSHFYKISPGLLIFMALILRKLDKK